MNRFVPHVYVIPEDDRDRQLADGFCLHFSVDARRIQVMPPSGGWGEVLDTFKTEYIGRLRNDEQGHVVLLIDFDGDYESRRAKFEREIPEDLRPRVFVLGAKQTPEELRKALGMTYEDIGKALAEDCSTGSGTLWLHDDLKHNDADRKRLVQVVRGFLFPK